MAAPALLDPFKGLDPSDALWLREQTDTLRELFDRATATILRIGAVISQVRGRVAHGYYMAWLAVSFPFTHETARKWALAADTFGQIPTGLDFEPTALFILSQPTTPPEARELALRLAGEGHTITAAAVRNILRELKPDAPTEPRTPRSVLPPLRVFFREGEREARFTFDLRRDPDDDVIVTVSLGGVAESGRDLAAVLSQLAERVRRPAPTDPPAIDPAEHLDWCDGVAGGVAVHHGFRRSEQRWEDVRGAGRAALLDCCRRFELARVRPDSTARDAFRGWAHQYVRQAADREAKRERSGGTFHTKRDTIPGPAFSPLPAEAC